MLWLLVDMCSSFDVASFGTASASARGPQTTTKKMEKWHVIVSSTWQQSVKSFVSFHQAKPKRSRYWVLLGFSQIQWILLGSNWVWSCSSSFYLAPRSLTRFYWVLLGFQLVFQWVLLGSNWVWSCSSGFYLAPRSLTRFYWVLLGFTEFFLVPVGFIGFQKGKQLNLVKPQRTQDGPQTSRGRQFNRIESLETPVKAGKTKKNPVKPMEHQGKPVQLDRIHKKKGKTR